MPTMCACLLAQYCQCCDCIVFIHYMCYLTTLFLTIVRYMYSTQSRTCLGWVMIHSSMLLNSEVFRVRNSWFFTVESCVGWDIMSPDFFFYSFSDRKELHEARRKDQDNRKGFPMRKSLFASNCKISPYQ